MCGIFGMIGKNFSQQTLFSCFSCLQHRGNDCFGYYNGKEIQISKNKEKFRFMVLKARAAENSGSKITHFLHCLHSFVGTVPQPLQNKNKTAVLLANCEIYNWQLLAKKYNINAKNDADILLQLLDARVAKIKNIKNLAAQQLADAVVAVEQQLDGDYAFAYCYGDYIVLSRDSVGVKPLCYAIDVENKLFVFSSEKKIIEQIQQTSQLLCPRDIVVYQRSSNMLQLFAKPYFRITNKKRASKTAIRKTLLQLLFAAVDKRIVELAMLPISKRKLAILFSGGVDSTTLALLAKKINQQKKLGIKIILYTAAFSDGNIRAAPDVEAAENAAKFLSLPLYTKKVSLQQTEKVIPEIMKIIEANDPVKVGVALPFYFCSMRAKQDGCKVILSGLGSEELFAGYQRHAALLQKNGYVAVNPECLDGLKNIWQRDLYRDDLLTMHFQLELRLPFLDKKLIAYAVQIPAELKINNLQKKIILREVAEQFGLPAEFSQRKKIAAQYGSNFDKALEKLARKAGMQKGVYLKNVLTRNI